MKKYIIPILLLIASIGLSFYVYNKININNYNKIETDNDFIKLMNGTETILTEAVSQSQLDWGKSGNNSKISIYLKYASVNLGEMGLYLKNRNEDKFTIEASLFLDDLYDLYNLNELIGNNQEEYAKNLKRIQKNIKLHKKELIKVIK